MTLTDTTTKDDEDEILSCVRELKSEVADLKEGRPATSTAQESSSGSLGDLRLQLTQFQEERKAATQKLEAQTSAITQLQQQMNRIEQLCMKLDEDLNALSTKA